jgi:hypothetical protein
MGDMAAAVLLAIPVGVGTALFHRQNKPAAEAAAGLKALVPSVEGLVAAACS